MSAVFLRSTKKDPTAKKSLIEIKLLKFVLYLFYINDVSESDDRLVPRFFRVYCKLEIDWALLSAICDSSDPETQFSNCLFQIFVSYSSLLHCPLLYIILLYRMVSNRNNVIGYFGFYTASLITQSATYGYIPELINNFFFTDLH